MKCVGYLGLGLGFLIASLPRSVRGWFGDLIGVLWFDVFRIRRKVAVENVAIAFPQLRREQQTRIARASVCSLGRTIVEFSLFPFFKNEDVPRYFEIRGRENYEKAAAKGKGVCILSMHVGNGDFGVSALSRSGIPASLISKTFKAKWLNELWFGMRAKHGTQFIAPEKSSFQILRALKAKRAVFFVLDQYMGPPVGCRTMFFGRETGTAMGLALMAERSGSPVVPSYTFRKKDGSHVIVIEPEIPWQDASSGDQNIATMTQIYTYKIEEIVRQHPEQWMWIHRRWKTFG